MPDHEDLLRRIAERRTDTAFMARLERVVNDDRDILDALADKPKVEVYSRPECVFNYCPSPEWCEQDDCCQQGRGETRKAAQ